MLTLAAFLILDGVDHAEGGHHAHGAGEETAAVEAVAAALFIRLAVDGLFDEFVAGGLLVQVLAVGVVVDEGNRGAHRQFGSRFLARREPSGFFHSCRLHPFSTGSA